MMPHIISARNLREKNQHKSKEKRFWAADLQKDFLGNAYIVLTTEDKKALAYRLDPYLNLSNSFYVGTSDAKDNKRGFRTYTVFTSRGNYLIKFSKNVIALESEELKIKASKAVLKESDNYIFLFLTKGKNVDAVLIDRFQGLINKFTIKSCNLRTISCNNNLCIANCGNDLISVTPYGSHPIIDGLKPLLYCEENEYYYDRTNNTIVRYAEEEITPLIKYRPIMTKCLGKNMILFSDGTDTFVLDGILGLHVHKGKTNFVDGHGSLVVLSGEDNKIIAIGTHELRKYFLTSKKCVIDSSEVTYCLSKETFLTSLDLSDYVEESVRVLKNEVTRNNYAIIEVKPWGPSHTYTLIGPVKVISAFQARNTLRLSVRPVKLGWQGKVLINIESPVYRYQGIFTIKSHAPIIKKAIVRKCLYSSTGLLGDGKSNLRLLLNVSIDKKAPEDYRIDIRSNEVRNLKVLWRELISQSQQDEWALEVWGYVRSLNNKVLRLSVFSESFLETSYVGDLYVNKQACREVKEPHLKLVTDFAGEGVLVTSAHNAKLRAYCSNKVYENYNILKVPECFASPLLIEILTTDGNFRWIRKELIRVPIRTSFHEGENYRVTNNLGRFIIDIPKYPHPSTLFLTGVAPTPNRKSDINVSFRIQNSLPSLNIIFCGKSSKVIYDGSEGNINCDLIRSFNGLYLLSLYPGLDRKRSRILKIDGSLVLKEVIAYAMRVANELERRL